MKREWTNSSGERWGCDANDHSPFCRLCVRLDCSTEYDAQRTQASIIVDAVWDDLMGRSGFDGWLISDDGMEQEIKNDLRMIVRRLL